jgi:hypothetical protein
VLQFPVETEVSDYTIIITCGNSDKTGGKSTPFLASLYVKLLQYIQFQQVHLWVSAILPHKHVLAPNLQRNIVRK